MTQSQAELLRLLSGGLRGEKIQENTAGFNWQEIYSLAKMQAVVPLALISAVHLRETMPAELRERWRMDVIGLTLHGERLMRAQDRILRAMESENIPCAILKGSSLAAHYPDPQMRSLGDIDLLVRLQEFERASAQLKLLGFQPRRGEHPFHIDFHGNGITVELHHAVSDFPKNPGGENTRRVMQDCLEETVQMQLQGHSFPALRDKYQAISLLAHMQRHMLEGGMGLRQLCDWAVFVSSAPEDAFAREILPVLEKCGLKRFACTATLACAEYLGLDEKRFSWAMQADGNAARELLEEFLRTGNFGAAAPEDLSDFLVEAQGSKNVVQAVFYNLNRRANRHFPITEKMPALLPIFWVFLPVRYVFRILTGKRNKKSIAKSVATAQNRNRLYRNLGLFEAEETPKE